MELFIPSENRDQVTYYKFKDTRWEEIILRDAVRRDYAYAPTVVKTHEFMSNIPKRTDQFYYEDDQDVVVLEYCYQKEIGERLLSNVGCAGHGCDHFYEKAYEYSYLKHYLISELANAIRVYYSTVNLDIPKARESLNRIKECIHCSRSDLFQILDIFKSLSFQETREFTNLDELVRFIFMRDSFDRAHSLDKYKSEIEGLRIEDICSRVSESDPYTITRIKHQLCDREQGRQFLDFMPEINDKKQMLSRILER